MNKDEWENQGRQEPDLNVEKTSEENPSVNNELNKEQPKNREEIYNGYKEVEGEYEEAGEEESSTPNRTKEEWEKMMNQGEPENRNREKKPSGLKSGILGGLIGGATVALLGGGILFGSGALQPSVNSSNDAAITSTDQDSPTSNVAVNVTNDTTAAVDEVQDSVVSIINMVESSGNPFGFMIPQTEQQGDTSLVTQGEGSGVIYKIEDGLAYVVTNNHVIEKSDALEVLMKDGTKKEAELVGSDVWTDLAVLTIPAEGIDTVAQFGDSDALKVGEPAIAIGSPLGTKFATSVTQGIVSATERTVATDIDGDGVTDWDITAIQTDASINPGNSGGALINIAGKVIGINSMKIADANVEGMGFAIPSNDVVKIIAELEEHGEVIRPVLGVSMLDLQQVSASQQRSILNIPDDVTTGVVVADVQRLSAAEVGGLKQYDVIVEMDGQEVGNMVELRKVLYAQEVGSSVEVKFYRDGELQTLQITLTDGQPSL